MAHEPDWADEAEDRLLTAALLRAPRLGWNGRLVAAAARETGLTLAEAELLLPHGARDLAALAWARHDRSALAALALVDPALKIRERIGRAVLERCDAARFEGEAGRRLAGFLTLPANIPLALRLAWGSAEAIWRWAGDTASDENHYTKRALLAEILVSTLAIDLAGGREAAARHLDRRIAAVMAFERWKARLPGAEQGVHLARTLGRLRYGRG
ncbi:MAG: COQ9 family protein [Caulobacteraceae bacterium]